MKLSSTKKSKLQNALNVYFRQYLKHEPTELDESGTRIMVNTFLTDVLCFRAIEEVKTEYMIKGTYADYVVQLNGVRHFLVEVKSLSLKLSEKHLRQAINYGANEGIDWALLTNGKQYELHRIIFGKPIESKKVLSFDFSNLDDCKHCIEQLQYLHKDSVSNSGLDFLWNKTQALDPLNVASLLYLPRVVDFIRHTLRRKYKAKFSEAEVQKSLNSVVTDAIPIESLKLTKHRPIKRQKDKNEVGAAPKIKAEPFIAPAENSLPLMQIPL